MKKGFSKRSIYMRDVVSSSLFVAPCYVIIPLASFIAAKRLNAPVFLLSIMITGSYIGPIWNLFFSRLTARVSIGKSVVLFMLLSSVFVVLAGFQSNAVVYCTLIMIYLFFFGLFSVQYNTLIKHVYTTEERQRKLSYRYLSISALTVVLSLVFGVISVRNYTPISIISGGLIVVAAVVFNTLRGETAYRMEPFQAREVFGAIRGDKNFMLVAIAVTLYGIVGAGLNAPLALLYTRLGYAEDSVGVLSAIRIGGTVLAAALITPNMNTHRGVRNFRLPFLFAFVALVSFFLVGVIEQPRLGFWILVVGNLLFGFAISSFSVSVQTTAIALAPKDKTTLYVNAMMIVFGMRGLYWPFIVGLILRSFGFAATLAVMAAVTAVCIGITKLGRAR
jgi:hypothetical protein